MTRTRTQVLNIRKGCKKRDKKLIIHAQQKRHLKAKINQAIIDKLKKINDLETAKNWVNRLETITSTIAMEQLLQEIQN